MSAPRVALVTGSNKGIGYAIVKELCTKFNGIVYLTSRDEQRGKEAVEELAKLGLHPHYHQLDIDDESSILTLRNYLKEKYGGLDVLVNNAAIAFKMAATEPFAEQAVKTVATNFTSTLNVCKILFPILKPHARVVNVSSSAGHLFQINGKEPESSELRKRFSSPNLTVDELCKLMEEFVKAAQEGNHVSKGWPNGSYKVSKVGVSALTRIQQREFDHDSRQDIIVNSVHPGYVATDMSSYKGPLTVEEGAAAPTYLALLPPNVTGPKGAYMWHDKRLVEWTEESMPAAY